MRKSVTALSAYAAFIVLLGAADACGRSDSIGWADRERPGRDRTSGGQAASGPAAREPTEAISPELAEYQRVAKSLQGLRVKAMEDETLAARWTTLLSAVDSRVAQMDEFKRGLVERQYEIEVRFAEAEESGEEIAEEERTLLMQQYQNVQSTLGDPRNEVFAQPEFARALEAYKAALYRKMRSLEPQRAAEVDRLEFLTKQLYQWLDSVTPPPLAK